MAPPLCMLIFLLFFSFPFSSSFILNNNHSSLSFPLTLTETPLVKHVSNSINKNQRLRILSSYNVKSSFKYSMALVVSLPIGTPPQIQQMVLDTGSQLSWIQCNPKQRTNSKTTSPRPPTTTFDPSLSSSFSLLPCTHPACKPPVPDFTLPTSCDQNRICHYSYFYADGTYAEGKLVREKLALSNSQSTPPLILGCAQDSKDPWGILGMNRGRLSFPSQAQVTKFSYCVPTRQDRSSSVTGSFYLGDNPDSSRFRYVDMLTFPQSQTMPNLDPLAFTVPMQGIRIGATKLNIPPSVFKPDAGGSGQTMVDSGSELTYLVDAAYNRVREEVVRLVGPRIKKGYVYGNAADMCFDGNAVEIGRLIGDMAFEFELASSALGDFGDSKTVSLCVKRLVYTNENGELVKGVCSNFLCDLKPGAEVKITGPVGKEMLMPKDPNATIIMLATGTGIAPFRSFLWKMFFEKHDDYKFNGLAWLFLGVPTSSSLLYKEEFEKMKEKNPEKFRLDFAVSREQTNEKGEKMYIQTRMAQYAEELWELLKKDNTFVYMCGLKGMEKGIDDIMVSLAARDGIDWTEYKRQLKKAEQWNVEVY